MSLSFPSIHVAIFFCPPTHPPLSIPFIHLSVYPHVDLSTSPLIHSPSTYLRFPQCKHMSICPPTYPSMHPTVLTHQPTYPLFVYLPTHSVITHKPFICPSLFPPLLSPIHSFTHSLLESILSTFFYPPISLYPLPTLTPNNLPPTLLPQYQPGWALRQAWASWVNKLLSLARNPGHP